MIDLLESKLGADEITSLLRRIKLQPLLPAMDAPEWEAAKRKAAVQGWMKGISTLVEKEAFEPLPAMSDELYALFAKTGERIPFESIYFERRRRVARVAMVVLLGDAATRQKYSPALVEMIEQTMGEESWTFPAHSGQVSGKDPMMVDLFAAETANLMAELLTIFGAVIPADLAQRIKQRLRIQYFDNYLQNGDQFRWTSMENNWNSVCHQGVIGAALAVETDMELLGKMLAPMGPRLKIFLNAFGQDGSTSEGSGYWSYGFGRFAELNRQLETATSGELSVFGTNEHIKRIAAFAPALVFSNGYLVNFSDGAHAGRLNAALLNYLSQRLEMPRLEQDGTAIYRNMAENGLTYRGQRCDLFFYTRFFLGCPDDMATATEPPRRDAYFPDYGAVVARGRDAKGNFWEFAAKGGHNEEMHNHNDCGSFLLNFNGEPALIEIGAPEYVKDFFRFETRYEFLAARSLGHSVPLVYNCEQAVGRQFVAEVLECKLETDRVTFVLELAKAYPPQAKCRKLIRTFEFSKSAGRLTLSDDCEIEGKGSVESMLMCHAPVTLQKGGATIAAPGGTLTIHCDKATKISAVDVLEYKDHTGQPRKVNRIRFAPLELESNRYLISYQIES